MNIGICFGGYCPLHQGHMDLIMTAKKENDYCFVIVCGYEGEERGDGIGLPLKRRHTLVKQTFKGDEQIIVLTVNDTQLGIDESMSDSNWDIWLKYVEEIVYANMPDTVDWNNKFTFYVADPKYKEAIDKRVTEYSICRNCKCFERVNPISGTLVRNNPLKYWHKIALPFRSYFSKNILITGTASEGKSTLTRDIATYFGIPYSEEYGRTYMAEYCKQDTDLTINDFQEFLIGQRRDTKAKIESYANNGIVISDTDNVVTLMYAQAYTEDENIDLSWGDYKILEDMAQTLKRGITWDKIFLLPPKNKFVDDGSRYMVQSTIDERQKNFNKLVKLIKQFGWWDKVEILDNDFLGNFNRVKDYINELEAKRNE